MKHLLHGDVDEDGAPPLDRHELLSSKTLVDALLQAVGRVEMLAHDPVLELGGLSEQVPEVLTVLDHDPWLTHG